ncbi:hypothetical protein CJJ23_01835 [Mycoplasmopsis agassizii]|uniref:Uncharacterized protein n=2 Tax=Mycoplasmopsis agassizii TaxID=33922 RepID=A0A269TJC6_9BACT|nr:hypothetical protein CJJ23_01835 [Mycoplasmopsis agassizii]
MPLVSTKQFIESKIDEDGDQYIFAIDSISEEILSDLVIKMSEVALGFDVQLTMYDYLKMVDVYKDERVEQDELLEEKGDKKHRKKIEEEWKRMKVFLDFYRRIDENLTSKNLTIIARITKMASMMINLSYNEKSVGKIFVDKDTVKNISHMVNRITSKLEKYETFRYATPTSDKTQKQFFNTKFLKHVGLRSLWQIKVSNSKFNYKDAVRLMAIYLIGLQDKNTKDRFSELTMLKQINPRTNRIYTCSINDISKDKWAAVANALNIKDFEKLWTWRNRPIH